MANKSLESQIEDLLNQLEADIAKSEQEGIINFDEGDLKKLQSRFNSIQARAEVTANRIKRASKDVGFGKITIKSVGNKEIAFQQMKESHVKLFLDRMSAVYNEAGIAVLKGALNTMTHEEIWYLCKNLGIFETWKDSESNMDWLPEIDYLAMSDDAAAMVFTGITGQSAEGFIREDNLPLDME